MKNNILILFFVLLGTSVTMAQTTTDQVKLNVVLNPMRSVTVTNNQTVDLVFQTAEDYENGVSKTIADQLNVSSIGSGYRLYAKSSIDNPKTGDKSINGENITVAISKGTGTATVASANIRDMAAKKDMYFNQNPVLNEKLSVTYAANLGGKEKYIDKLIENKTTTYTVVITYSVETN